MAHIKRKRTKTKTVLIDGKKVTGVVGQKKGESRIEARREEERRRNKARREKKEKKEPIKLEKKKGVKDFAKGLLTGDIVRGAAEERGTGLKTGVLPITGIGGAAAGATAVGETARITRTATELNRFGKSLTTQRAFIGKSATSNIDKIFHTVRPIASRYAVNSKSAGLTTSLFKKTLKLATSPAILLASIGTYPFAGFIKEEALQQTGFAFNEAERNNDLQGMEDSIAETEDILNAAPTILSSIPFTNVLTQLKKYFEAVAVKLEVDKRLFAQKKGELSGELQTEFEESQAEARQTQLEERTRDAEYFALIREGKFDEAQELLDTELKGGVTNE